VISAIGLLVVGAALQSPAQPAQHNAETVAWLLGRRCAECHGPDSEDRRALKRWDAALDLAETARDPNLLVPGDPLESNLLFVIEEGEMPPPDSDVPALSTEELALLRAWIQAGAPVPTGAEVATSGARERPAGWLRSRFVEWLGRFHPMLVHFPIALLFAALGAELASRICARDELRGTATFCLGLGALTAPLSGLLGWFLAENSRHDADDLFWHKWLGVSVMLLSITTLWVARRWPRLRLPLFALLAILVGVTGHYGSTLSFGDSWLRWPR
jgi:uncharacterized membrane protein/mono/diheme cytochrome c family protein